MDMDSKNICDDGVRRRGMDGRGSPHRIDLVLIRSSLSGILLGNPKPIIVWDSNGVGLREHRSDDPFALIWKDCAMLVKVPGMKLTM